MERKELDAAWAAWEELSARIPEDIKNLDELPEEFHSEPSALEILVDLEEGLGVAGREDPKQLRRRLDLCEALTARFPDSDPALLLHFRQSRAEALFGLDRVAEGEGEFRDMLKESADDVMIYLSWGDMYGVFRMSEEVPEDLDRAEEIYRQGLEQISVGHELLRARLATLRHARRDESDPAFLENEGIQALLSVGDGMSTELWAALVEVGPELVPALQRLLEDIPLIQEELQESEDPSAEAMDWGISHAAFLAARIGAPELVPAFLEAVDACSEDDWIDGGLPWFPTRFGPDAVELFMAFSFDLARDPEVRAGIAEGLVWAAGLMPELRPAVAAGFADAISSKRFDAEGFTPFLMYFAARIDDDAVHAALQEADARGVFDEELFGPLAEHVATNPRDWYLDEAPEHGDDEAYLSELPGA